VKPELTFRRSLRLISQRWWLLLLGGVLFAALAFFVAGQRKPHYVATADLNINDTEASRQHAAVEIRDAAYTVNDLGSTNGTLVNDEAVEERTLREGDRIGIGGSVLEFRRR